MPYMSTTLDIPIAPSPPPPQTPRLDILRDLERKALWLSTWMIHHANHLRPKRDGLKVGGHQASSASVATLLTALYFDVLHPQDRVAVKPHASPVYHAIQYLMGKQTRENLERFRALGGAQAYPSRTKDCDGVDFSTGSVGLGVGVTLFAAMVQDYLRQKDMLPQGGQGGQSGRMVAIVGDAELDEGNVFEAMYEGWKHDVRNVWWVIDYNRQSLDSITEDRSFTRIENVFRGMGWNVVTLKYGKRLEAIRHRSGGQSLLDWIDACPNAEYSSLVFRGGAAWRQRLLKDFADDRAVQDLIGERDDEELQALMTNLGGHDMQTVLDAFHGVKDDTPTCFIAYTIKGFGLPFAGHKDNHAGLLSPQQLEVLRERMRVPVGREWDPFAGLATPDRELKEFLVSVPLADSVDRRHQTVPVSVPQSFSVPPGKQLSTQAGFGRLLHDLASGDSDLASRIVTCSPDVTVSTNLGPWVNRRGVFDHRSRPDVFQGEGLTSAQQWSMSPRGQHIELGIAENNLFLLLAALGLSGELFGQKLFPIGTLYDPFISRGLDSLNYACYQGARFMLVATPSGLTLAPEGGAHQSVLTPLIGMGQPGLTFFEPTYVDELAVIFGWSLEHMQADDGGAVYLRLSTRSLDQPARVLTDELRRDIIEGGYWLIEPEPNAELALVCCGPVTPEVLRAHEQMRDDFPGAGVLIVTSADRLHAGWLDAQRHRRTSHVQRLLAPLSPDAALVSILDGHPLTLSWLGGVARHRIVALGNERFGQSGDIRDLYRAYELDDEAIVDGVVRACLQQLT